MHFRIRKNVIQLIRTTYDDGKKKGSSHIVGSLPLSNPELTEELQAKLMPSEIAAFQIWLSTQHRMVMLREELAAMSLAESMALAEKWFEREGRSAAAEFAAQNILAHWQLLRKVLSKQGLLD